MEQTLRLWRDDDYAFNQQARVDFAWIDRNGHLKPAEVSRTFMELAGADFAERQLSHKYMMNHGYYFILTRQVLDFFRDIEDGETVQMVTWPYRIKSMQVYRYYEMRTMEGDLICNGTGIFMVIGPEGRPIRIREFPFLSWEETICERPVESEPHGRIKARGDLQEISRVTARFNDLDRNGHMNNARYYAFAQNALPENLQNTPLSQAVIGYDAETVVGEQLAISVELAQMQHGVPVPDENGHLRLFAADPEGKPSFAVDFCFAERTGA